MAKSSARRTRPSGERRTRAGRSDGTDHRSPTFDYSLDFRVINFRTRPDLYRIGRGEEGVLLVEPYKSEILPHWRFRTPAIARTSAAKITSLFRDYKRDGDFVGMDMARKYLQMGYTRARRYTNHKGGRKYGPDGSVLPYSPDATKAAAAAVFYTAWKAVEADSVYRRLKVDHRARFG